MTPPLELEIDEILSTYVGNLESRLRSTVLNTLLDRPVISTLAYDKMMMAALDMGIEIIVTAASMHARRVYRDRGKVIIEFASGRRAS